MNDDIGFLRAIKDNPNDHVARLVYADWLDEHGDIRGEYLRLEHQLTQISLRLAQLREQIEPGWVVAVTTRRKVVLAAYHPHHKIMVIKLVREITSLGLVEAKTLVESSPCAVAEDLSVEEAEQLAKRLKDYAVVSVEPMTPM